VGVVTLFLIMSSVKLLPTMEAPQHFHTSLPKMVVPLISEGLFDDVLLRRDTGIEGIKTLHGELEGWDNVGLYTGLGLIVAGCAGFLYAPRNMKWLLGIPLLLFILLGEGTVYELVLRKIPLIGSFLRLPSRSLIVAIWILSIYVGFFMDKLFVSKKIFLRILSILCAIYLIFDISTYTYTKLHQIATISYPEAKEQGHPLTAPLTNSVAPSACQDFNAPPSFVKKFQSIGPLRVTHEAKGDIQAFMSPNEIRIVTPPAGILTVYSTVSPLASVENGTIMTQANAVKDGSIVISVTEPGKDVVVRYISRTFYGALVISMAGWLAAISILFSLRRRLV